MIVDVVLPLAVTVLGDAETVDWEGDIACATMTSTVAVTEPDVARTVDVPFVSAVTRPVPTPDVATDTDVPLTRSHVTVGFEIG